jgi:hypothetical protein
MVRDDGCPFVHRPAVLGGGGGEVGGGWLYSCMKGVYPGVKKRCRLSWLTNSALEYGPKCGGRGRVTGSQPMRTAVHMEPKVTLEILLHI